MKNSIEVHNHGKYTWLDFPKRNVRLLYNRITKKYNFYRIEEKAEKAVKKSGYEINPTVLVLSGLLGLVSALLVFVLFIR